MKNLKLIIFFLCYAILLADTTLRHVDMISGVTHALLNYIAMPLLVLLIIDNLNGLSFKRAMLVIGVIAIGICTRIISNDNTIMMATLFICAFKDIDLDSLIKFSVSLRIVLLITLLALFYLGFAGAATYMREDGVLRYAYGFSNLNGLSTYILSTILQILYLGRKNIRVRHALLVIAGIIVIFITTGSRTQSLILLATLVYVVISIFKKRGANERLGIRNRCLRFFIMHSFTIMALLAIVAYVAYANNNELARTINVWTSGRISSAKTLIDANGIALFGQEVDRLAVNGVNRVLDSGYAYLMLYYGPIVMIALAFAYKKVFASMFSKKEDESTVFLTIYNIIGLVERFAFEISPNPFLLQFSSLLYPTTTKNEEKVD